tara:strand:+ start:347 stop:739 length:393 start_codon:yes stop_codon:yes gene_type:complete
MKPLRLELVPKLSTILMELHANNFKFMISTCINKKKCFGKCLLKPIFIDIQLLVLLILLKDVIQKLLKSLDYVIFIHTLCLRPNPFNFKKEEKILDICYNLEIRGEIKNGLDPGVITVAPGKLILLLTGN